LILSLLAGVVAPIPGARADTFGDYIYTVSGGKATITGYTGPGGVVVLPSMLGGYPVTMIGIGAFESTQGHLLTGVTIANSVTMILGMAFRECTRLTSVVIPNSVTRIGSAAFWGCTALTSLVIPNSVTEVESNAIQGCTALTSLTIGTGLKNIQYAVFSGCTALTSVTIPNTVTSIGDYTFHGCTALTTAMFLGNAPSGGQTMFAYCSSDFHIEYLSGATGWTNPWYGYPASAFSGATYTLTTTPSPPAGGSIGWSPVATSYTSGTVVTLTATPAAGYTFTGWSGDVTGTANPQTITMDGNKAVTATFAATPTYTLTPTAGAGGGITPNTVQTVLQGGSMSFGITPAAGYRVADVTVDGVSVGRVSTYEFVNVTSSHTIKAVFEKEQERTVIVLQIGKSTFTVNGTARALDSPPVIKNGRTLVPIRAIIEALGGTVGWDGTARKATVTLGSTTIELWIGKAVAKVNGVSTPIDPANANVVPEIINGRTMLPVRFVSENLGCLVEWADATKTITITYQP
jgi:uncharacterized repeat protein (TIGR02543 family)